MVVVTAAAGDERDGCLVGFHSQSSIHPRRYVVWLSVANRTYRIAQRADHLAVHALTASDHALAERFGGTTGDDTDKLADVGWSPGPGGAPLLDDLPTRFVGRVEAWLPATEGDHRGVVLVPVDAAGADLAPGGPFRLRQARDITPGHPA
jgi:flavin reductase (DIM6/NTAB) family NADH-FMN oxidoreductase RutF